MYVYVYMCTITDRLFIVSYLKRTQIRTHCVRSSKISILATCFGHYVTVISEYNTTYCLKHIKIDTLQQ